MVFGFNAVSTRGVRSAALVGTPSDLVLTMTDGTTVNIGRVQGRGIADTEVLETGEIKIYWDDGSEPSVIGRDVYSAMEALKDQAEAAKDGAETAQTAAETAQAAAETAQQNAHLADLSAQLAKMDAEAARVEANLSATNSRNWATASKTYSENAEAYAVGTKDGAEVDEDDPAYENNAKYYAELADSDRQYAYTYAAEANAERVAAQAARAAAEAAAATFETDTTLAISGKAADAQSVGDILVDRAIRCLTSDELTAISGRADPITPAEFPFGTYFMVLRATVIKLFPELDGKLNAGLYVVLSYRAVSYPKRGQVDVFSITNNEHFQTYHYTNDGWGTWQDKSYYPLDNTLTTAGAAADAKAVGDMLVNRSLRCLTSEELSTITSMSGPISTDDFPFGTYFTATPATIINLFPSLYGKLNAGLYVVLSYRTVGYPKRGQVDVFALANNEHFQTYHFENTGWADWMDKSYYPLDDTLTTAGAAADAKETGDLISALDDAVDTLGDRALRRLETDERPSSESEIVYGTYFTGVGSTISEIFTSLPYTLISDGYYLVETWKGGSQQRGCVRITLLSYIARTGQYLGYLNDGTLSWRDISGEVASKAWLTENVADILNTKVGVYNVNKTSSGVTVIGNAITRTFTFSGTATGTVFQNILTGSTALPDYLHPEDTMYIYADGLSADGVYLNVFLYKQGGGQFPYSPVKITGNEKLYIPEDCGGMIARLEVASGTSLTQPQTVSLRILNGPAPTEINRHIEGRSIKLLCYGNSFSYSTLAYMPLILQDIAPETHVILGICYDSGQTISGHLEKWDEDATYTTYHEYDSNAGKWIKLSSSVTGKQAAMRRKWDGIILQTYRRDTDTTDTSVLEEFADTISAYIDYPVMFLYNMAQPYGTTYESWQEKYQDYPTGRDKQIAMFEDQAAYAEKVLDGCVVSEVLPCGTAIQNARTSSLDDYGTGGDMTHDTYHLQQGIPILVTGYAAAYKVCQIFGLKPKIFSSQFSPTDAWVAETEQPPSSRVPVVGVTEANKLIAQKCALMAIKHPFEISDMSQY